MQRLHPQLGGCPVQPADAPQRVHQVLRIEVLEGRQACREESWGHAGKASLPIPLFSQVCHGPNQSSQLLWFKLCHAALSSLTHRQQPHLFWSGTKGGQRPQGVGNLLCAKVSHLGPAVQQECLEQLLRRLQPQARAAPQHVGYVQGLETGHHMSNCLPERPEPCARWVDIQGSKGPQYVAQPLRREAVHSGHGRLVVCQPKAGIPRGSLQHSHAPQHIGQGLGRQIRHGAHHHRKKGIQPGRGRRMAQLGYCPYGLAEAEGVLAPASCLQLLQHAQEHVVHPCCPWVVPQPGQPPEYVGDAPQL
mmetsp:Transcript_22730/g.62775  ORF Transcript_22730/g.62775 Transcript_22730/m.62775 type:complete len:305 (-) Transcript_22730:534-1448(-)